MKIEWERNKMIEEMRIESDDVNVYFVGNE